MKVEMSGLTFPEVPRWHNGRLWFADVYGDSIHWLMPDGGHGTRPMAPHQPGGLGFDPQGRLMIVSRQRRQVLREQHGEFTLFADLASLAPTTCNDMTVDAAGRAYVGNWGFNLAAGDTPKPTVLILVKADGNVAVAADNLLFPNGVAISGDGMQLYIAETAGHRISAFHIKPDGSLADRRIFADLGTGMPDGLCLDAEGALWVADVHGKRLIRVLDGGQITREIPTGPRHATACVLGGSDRKTLYVTSSLAMGPASVDEKQGQVASMRVDVPGDGIP